MDCIVLNERGLSWSFALQALRVERLSTVMVSASAEARMELQGTNVASSMREVEGKLESVKDRVTPSTLVFIKGFCSSNARFVGWLSCWRAVNSHALLGLVKVGRGRAQQIQSDPLAIWWSHYRSLGFAF